MNQLHPIDSSIIFAYFVFILILGLKRWRQDRLSDAKDFLLASRKLTLPAFVASLVSTWYGGILGVGEFSFRYGLSNWLVLGVPYYFAAALFGIFLARKARSLNLYTIPHQLERAYGKPASLLGAFFVFVMTVPAAYVLELAVLLKFFFGWTLWRGLIIGTILSTSFVLIGGFRSVVRTNLAQFLLMFGSFVFLLTVAFFHYGGFNYLQTHLPAGHLNWHGDHGATYIIVWFFIALETLIEPSFYQRCFAAKTQRTAQFGIFVSILFWIFFDFLITFTGLYARATLPDLQDPMSSYLALSQQLLPPIALGFFFIGMLATVMSTIDSYTFLAAITFGRDFLWRIKANASSQQINRYTRIGLVLSGALAIAIAAYAGSIIRIWKDVGSIGTPALLVPVISSLFPRLRMQRQLALVSMAGSAILSAIWLFSARFASGHFFFGIEPIYPGLIFSGFMWGISQLKKSQQRF